MIVPEHHLADILAGRCTEALLPDPDRERAANQPVSRRDGDAVCRVRITATTVVELDTLTDTEARQHGYATVAEWRDDWCRIHGCAWTGQRALLVTFRRAAEREQFHPFRGPWDPGSDGPGAERAPGPEPEKISPAVVKQLPSTLEARQRWQRAKLEQQLANEQMPLSERVERVLAEARAAGVSTDEYEQSILRRLRALENRTKKKAA